MEEDDLPTKIKEMMGRLLPSGVPLYLDKESRVSTYNNGAPEESQKEIAPTVWWPPTATNPSQPTSITPLGFSELHDLLSTLSAYHALVNFTIIWDFERVEKYLPIIGSGSLILDLDSKNLSNVPREILQNLNPHVRDLTQRPGGIVTVEAAIERDHSVDPPVCSWEKEEYQIRVALSLGYRHLVGTAQPMEPIFVEPDETDPPGVQLGLVKKIL